MFLLLAGCLTCFFLKVFNVSPPSIPDGLVFAKDRYGVCWEVTHEGSSSFFRPFDCARAGFAPQGGR
jgi:hypothetical protein